ncbi:hypothetical protein GOPIP_056_01080 [Gordonia polyisoprenivorans NBRC 16320 = JCM 10675]|nr:hypothetical protein GOPIP_056_01080 [Gordonia polyisoprenivorans NBRC 16320 = JCM 10675]
MTGDSAGFLGLDRVRPGEDAALRAPGQQVVATFHDMDEKRLRVRQSTAPHPDLVDPSIDDLAALGCVAIEYDAYFSQAHSDVLARAQYV